MTVHTFLAADSVSALEMVERNLGDDAYIHSVEWVDEKVQITASDDWGREKQTRPQAESESELAEHVNGIDARPRFLNPDSPKPFELVDQGFAPIDPEPQIAGSPLFFARSVHRREQENVTSLGIAQAKALSRQRVILLAPTGAEGGAVASRLARLRPQCELAIWYVESEPSSGEKDKVRESSTRMLHGSNAMAQPAAKPEIVLAVSHQNPCPSALVHAAEALDTAFILLLPAGLRFDRLDAIAAQTQHLASGVILLGNVSHEPTDDELAELDQAGLTPLWFAPDGELGLRPLEPPRDASVKGSSVVFQRAHRETQVMSSRFQPRGAGMAFFAGTAAP